jgi:hypothetical protein
MNSSSSPSTLPIPTRRPATATTFRRWRPRIFGPLEVIRDDATSIAISGSKMRGLIAMLALETRRAVSPERLSDALWANEDDRTLNRLQQVVSRLRRVLATPANGTASSPGPPVTCSTSTPTVSTRCASSASSCSTATPPVRTTPARSTSCHALARWRGPPNDVPDPGHGRMRSLLEELRAMAIEQTLRIDPETPVGRLRRCPTAAPPRRLRIRRRASRSATANTSSSRWRRSSRRCSGAASRSVSSRCREGLGIPGALLYAASPALRSAPLGRGLARPGHRPVVLPVRRGAPRLCPGRRPAGVPASRWAVPVHMDAGCPCPGRCEGPVPVSRRGVAVFRWAPGRSSTGPSSAGGRERVAREGRDQPDSRDPFALRDRRPDVGLRPAEHPGDVLHRLQRLALRGPARRCPGAERRVPARRTTSGDQPFPGARVPAGQHAGELVEVDRASHAEFP